MPPALGVDQLFGITGIAAQLNLSSSLVKGLTYALVLHPIGTFPALSPLVSSPFYLDDCLPPSSFFFTAAGLGFLALIFGLLAHLRNFPVAFATWFVSFAALFAVIAFVFDIVLFSIAKSRIESVTAGANASLGNAVWMTLAAAILFIVAGCLFGVSSFFLAWLKIPQRG